MRTLIVSLLGIAVWTSAAVADEPPGNHKPSYKRHYSHHSRIYSYPPTYIRDGHSYFYFPREDGRRDELAESIPRRYHHRRGYYSYDYPNHFQYD